MSILRNGNVACPCRLFSPMSHVKCKKRHAMSHVTLIFTSLSHVTCRIFLNTHVALSILRVKGNNRGTGGGRGKEDEERLEGGGD